ncbi:MAG: hypothetical protein OXF39_00550 [Nitrospira sp.]|nr:hypothetical protein [Nitrospira sp.]
MNWLFNLIKEYLLSDFLREKVSSVEKERDEAKVEVEFYRQKVDELERKLDAAHSDLSEETCDVLVYLFSCEGENCDIGCMADALKIERGMAQYHLDLLESLELAHCTGGNVLWEHTYWDLTPKGRRYVVEEGLLERTD